VQDADGIDTPLFAANRPRRARLKDEPHVLSMAGGTPMKRTLRWKEISLFLAVFIAAVFAAQSAPSGTRYEFDDPEGRPFLQMGYGGGSTPYLLSLQQYASGTAVLESSFNGTPTGQAEVVPFSYDELESILSTIVNADLQEYDQKVIEGKYEELARLEPSARGASLDSPVFVLEFFLREIPPAKGKEISVHRRITLGEPQNLAKRFPTVREFKALAQLLETYEAKRLASKVTR